MFKLKLNSVNLSEIFFYFVNLTKMYVYQYDYYDFYIRISNLKFTLKFVSTFNNDRYYFIFDDSKSEKLTIQFLISKLGQRVDSI